MLTLEKMFLFRIILWRIAFELFEVLKICRLEFGTVKNFAYGANLCEDVLIDRGIKPKSEQWFCLPDYQLVFDHQGFWRGFGYASVDPQPGEVVWGKLLSMSRVDSWRLNIYEAAYFLNRYRIVEKSHQGKKFFFYRTVGARSSLLPDQIYLDKLLSSYPSAPPEAGEFFRKLQKHPVLQKQIPEEANKILFGEKSDCSSNAQKIYARLCVGLLFFFIRKRGLVYGIKAKIGRLFAVCLRVD